MIRYLDPEFKLQPLDDYMQRLNENISFNDLIKLVLEDELEPFILTQRNWDDSDLEKLALEACRKTSDLEILGFRLLQKLVTRGAAYKSAITTASRLLKENRLSHAADLLKCLLTKGQAIDLGIDAVTLNKNNITEFNITFELCMELLRLGHACEIAVEFVEFILFEHCHGSIRAKSEVVNLYEGLFLNGYAFESAEKMAVELVKSGWHDVSFAICQKAIECNEGYKSAIRVAEVLYTEAVHKARKGKNSYFETPTLLAIYEQLFVKGQGYDSAITVASRMLHDSKDWSDISYKLYKALFSNGIDKATAIEHAAEIIHIYLRDAFGPGFRPSEEKRYHFLQVLSSLFSTGVTLEDIVCHSTKIIQERGPIAYLCQILFEYGDDRCCKQARQYAGANNVWLNI
jgi:hypothetical protein